MKVSIDKEKPELGLKVWVFNDSEIPYWGYRSNSNTYKRESNDEIIPDVTHWMDEFDGLEYFLLQENHTL